MNRCGGTSPKLHATAQCDNARVQRSSGRAAFRAAPQAVQENVAAQKNGLHSNCVTRNPSPIHHHNRAQTARSVSARAQGRHAGDIEERTAGVPAPRPPSNNKVPCFTRTVEKKSLTLVALQQVWTYRLYTASAGAASSGAAFFSPATPISSSISALRASRSSWLTTL